MKSISKQLGINLLELLLALAVIAVIILFSINRYKSYREKIAFETLQSGVQLIFSALDRYYQEQGCQCAEGFWADNICKPDTSTPDRVVLYRFKGNLTPSPAELGLPGNLDLSPWVDSFAAAIVPVHETDTDTETYVPKLPENPSNDDRSKVHRVLYQLRVAVTLNNRRTATQKEFLAQQLAGTLTGNQIVWQALPGSANQSASSNPLWILRGSRERFKQDQSDTSQQYQGCAH